MDIVIDHWGFPRAEPGAAPSSALKFDEKAFGDLCALGRKHNNLYLKLSAHFRVSSQEAPHSDLQPRFDAAVDAFGADRLMWGSDFPFVQLNGGQRASLEAVRGFCVGAGGAGRLIGRDGAAALPAALTYLIFLKSRGFVTAR